MGEYEVVCQLARGGMAELLLARHDGQLVVLKKILPQYARNPRFVKLFLAEADLVANLKHPNIAEVHALHEVEGDFFLSMEFILGKDVRSMLRRTSQRTQPISIAATVQIAHDVAAALHYAHERRQPDGALRGIVHRDVSPSNIVVSYEGVVKLVDFGIAKATATSVKTRTGILRGKVGYMSPEQARGGALDRRSDVFSLGIVLWELLTGRRLFHADNDLATIQQILHTTPAPPSSLRPDCPPELDRITRTALQRDQDRRYQTADELQRDLAAVASQVGGSGTLRAQMQRVFEPEITAWTEAQDAGLTLVEHVVATGIDLITPNSDDDGSADSIADADSVADIDSVAGADSVTGADSVAGANSDADPSSLIDDDLEQPTFLVAPEVTRKVKPPAAPKRAASVAGPVKVAGPAKVAMLDELEAPTVLAGQAGSETAAHGDANAPEHADLDSDPDTSEEIAPTAPRRLPSTVFVDPAIPTPLPHTPSAPVGVTSYPRLESDPHYARISFDHKPDALQAAPPKSDHRMTIVVLIVATIVGIVAAIVGRIIV